MIVFVSLLLLCGDVHPNPGPVALPCGVCERPVGMNHRAMKCDECGIYVHIKCDGLNAKDYELFTKCRWLSWECWKCRLPNLSDSFFDNALETNNYFELLSDDDDEPSLTMDNLTTQSKKRQGRKSQKIQKLKIMTVNCRSLKSRNKQLELHELIEEHNHPDIICGTESHLDKTTTNQSIHPNYNIERKDRTANGGGVFIAIHEKWLSDPKIEALDTNCEVLWRKLNICGSKPLHIGCYYRPTDRNINNVHELNTSLDKLPKQGQSLPNILLTGDFNVPDINWEKMTIKPDPQYGTELNTTMIDTFAEHNLTQVNPHPTRMGNRLDLVGTTNPDLIKKVSVHPGMSDHQVVITEIDVKAKQAKKVPRKVLLYIKGNMDGVRSDMKEFHEKFKDSDLPPEELNNIFTSELMDSIKKHIPTKIISGRWDIPWMTKHIKCNIKRKKRLYNKAQKTKKDSDWRKFRELRKHIKKKLREAHDEYVLGLLDFSDLELNRPTMGKRFWKYVKSRSRDFIGVPNLVENGVEVTDTKGKTEVMSRQYDSVFTNEDMENMPNKGDPQAPQIEPIFVTVNGIEKLLTKLNCKKANGPDLLPTRVLKECAQEIAPILQKIFQESLKKGEVPKAWRTANIVAIYKKGDKTCAANYRPVSLTSVPCKLLEHIMYSHIMEHCEEHDILVDFQHGFRTRHSCESQLITTLEDIFKAKNNGRNVDLLILDFSKAFDTVPHERLNHKLLHYGISGQVGKWIKMWLTDRQQRVIIDGEESEPVHVRSGVPQGTVLGPLLFLLYINDIGEKVKHSKIRLFADDSLLYREIDNEEDSDKLQEDLKALEEWAWKWQMDFNAKKCYLLSMKKRGDRTIRQYTLNGHNLAQVDHHPYLGIELQSNLKWDEHINNIVAKANRVLGFVRRNLFMCPRPVKEAAYFSISEERYP
jgi:hypothetical protein